MTESLHDSLCPRRGRLHQFHLIAAAILMVLMANVLPDDFLISTYRRYEVAPGDMDRILAVHKVTLDGCSRLPNVRPYHQWYYNTDVSQLRARSLPSGYNDPLFEFQQWKANLHILRIEEIKTVPYVPIPHPFVEQLIGKIRREYLDHVPFWNAKDLENKLACFQGYYNREREHQIIGGAIPASEPDDETPKLAQLDDFRWKSCSRGLYLLPIVA